MELNEFCDNIKETYKLSEDELSLLKYFVQTIGHSLNIHEITCHASIYFRELDRKNIHEILVGLLNKKIIESNKNEIYTLTESFKDNIKNVDIIYISAAIDIKTYEDTKIAMPSLNKILLEDENTVYVFLAITPHYVFDELKERIKRQRKTIFFMSDESCFRNKNEKNKHRDILNGWIEFVNINKGEYIEFYLVKNIKNNDNFRFLYSSLLAKNTVRFNIYKYNGDGGVVTGIGNLIECKMNENSLYDIVERGYTDAWNERIGVWKIDKKIFIKRIFANNLYWLLFSFVMLIGAIFFSLTKNSLLDFLTAFISVMGVIGFLLSLCKKKITKLFHKQKLFYKDVL